MTEPIAADLQQALRRLRLPPILDTLPERLHLAKQQKMPHQDFLELIFADEISRRESVAGLLRAKKAQLDPSETLENWDESAEVTLDRVQSNWHVPIKPDTDDHVFTPDEDALRTRLIQEISQALTS